MNWKLWIYGLFAAVIGAAASAAGNVFILPLVLDQPSIKKVLVITGLNAAFAGGIAFFGYLKMHPVPDWAHDHPDRRNDSGKTP